MVKLQSPLLPAIIPFLWEVYIQLNFQGKFSKLPRLVLMLILCSFPFRLNANHVEIGVGELKNVTGAETVFFLGPCGANMGGLYNQHSYQYG